MNSLLRKLHKSSQAWASDRLIDVSNIHNS